MELLEITGELWPTTEEKYLYYSGKYFQVDSLTVLEPSSSDSFLKHRKYTQMLKT